MPPAIGAIAAAASVGFGATTFFGYAGLTGALLAGASSLAISALTSALAPKPKTPNLGSFTQKATSRTIQVRQPVTAKRLVYGEVRVSGPLVFAASTNSNKHLHLVIVLAGHEVEAINEVWVNDQVIANDMLDGSGNVTSGRFSGKLRIKKHLGTAAQTADADLVSEVTEWTSNHRLRGHAYIYLRLQFDRDTYPTGIPNFSAVVQGMKMLDPRDTVTRWTTNAALMARHYIADTTYGYGTAAADIDDDAVNSAANSCDESVTTQNADYDVSSIATGTDIITLDGDRLELLRGDTVRWVTTGTAPGGLAEATDYYAIPYQWGGTPRIKLASSLANAIAGTAIDITSAGSGSHTVRKIAEPRYHGGGAVESDASRVDNLRDILTGMGGTAVRVGGYWSAYAAVYRAPTITLTESHLRGPLTIQTRVPHAERFNSVKGIYVSPINDWQAADYPVLRDADYVADDNGEELPTELDLPFMQRPHGARRIARIRLEQHRREISVEAPWKLTALRLQAADTMMLTNARAGWTDKVFEVHRHLLMQEDHNGAPRLGVDTSLRETDAAVYSWDSADESTLTPAARTNMPDPFTVTVVLGFSLDSVLIGTQDGDNTWKVNASWSAHTDQYVLDGGHYEIEFKKSSESVYQSAGKVDGSVTAMPIPQLAPDTPYDFNIYAINRLGVRSAPTPIDDFVAGTTATTTTEDWENETAARNPDDWEADSEASEDWET